ncbi:MAG: sulfotransferase [Flavobacteriales bacterium]
MPLPDFLCIGAQKAGTTTLYEYLAHHPEIYVPEQKELNFFNVASTYKKGKDWYEKEFFSPEKIGKARRIGEITPGYFAHPEAPARLVESLGNKLRLIVLLRDPVKRAFSHYLMLKKVGRIRSSFLKALEADEPLPKGKGFVEKGLYYEQFQRYLEFFSLDDLFIMKFEDFVGNPKEQLKGLYRFLSVEEEEVNEGEQQANKGSSPAFPGGEVIYKKTPMMDRIRNFVKKRPVLEEKLRKLLLKESPKITDKELQEAYSTYFRSDIERLEHANILPFSIDDWHHP